MSSQGLPYGEVSYWEERYKGDAFTRPVFEWYPGADELVLQALRKHTPLAAASLLHAATPGSQPPGSQPGSTTPPSLAAPPSAASPSLSSSSNGACHHGHPSSLGRVLDYGCGSSLMARLLAAEGYGPVMAVDASEAVIQQQREAQAQARAEAGASPPPPSEPAGGAGGAAAGAAGAAAPACATEQCEVQYEVMDCCSLDCPDNHFGLVVDKGTLDAIDCAGNTQLALQEVHRVLAPGGLFLLISCRDPASRLPHIKRYFALQEVLDIPEKDNPSSPCPLAHVYCMTKPLDQHE